MIIIENFFYFLLLLLVIFIYGYIVKVILLYLKQIILKKSVHYDKSIFNIIPNTPIKKILILFFIMSNVSLYNSNRNNWINPNTKHHTAKEFFATNLTVHFYRKVLNNIFHIDNPIMLPLNLLSNNIFHKGVQYLPKNDAESSYWYYRFHGYFYARNGGYMPDQNFTNIKTSPNNKHINILNDFYKNIEQLATHPIEDKKVLQEKYKITTLMADFFTNKRFLYFSNDIGYYARLNSYKDKKYLQKMHNLLLWTFKLEKEYKKDSTLTSFIEKEKPIIGYTYLHIPIELLKSNLHQKYINKTFHCSDPYIDLLYQYRKKLIAKNSPLYKLSISQQNLIKDVIFNSTLAQSMIYYIFKTCHKKTDVYFPTQIWIDKNYNMGDIK